MPAIIRIYVQPLIQFIQFHKNDFATLSDFHRYKKNRISEHRKHLISTFFDLNIALHEIQPTEWGKPYLVDYPAYSFNHSHSQTYYALAMSKQMQDLGVDVEDIDRQVRFNALAKHAFHPKELQKWQETDFETEYWFKVWTTKEAILKASGLGIRMSLNDLDTQVDPVQNGGVCQHPELGVFAYQNYRLAHCMLTVAWRSELSCKGFAFPHIEIIQH